MSCQGRGVEGGKCLFKGDTRQEVCFSSKDLHQYLLEIDFLVVSEGGE